MMNKNILIGSIIAVAVLITLSFPTAIGESEEIVNNKMNIYRFAKIQTTGRTNGMIYCLPGLISSYFSSILFPNRIFIFRPVVIYGSVFGYSGWNLRINGEPVPEGQGYIFGFSGEIENIPAEIMEFIEFNIDGIGLLIIHKSG